MVNDTISDMLTRIRNANLAYKTCVSIPKTRIHKSICEILECEGFIEKFYVNFVQRSVESKHLISDASAQMSK